MTCSQTAMCLMASMPDPSTQVQACCLLDVAMPAADAAVGAAAAAAAAATSAAGTRSDAAAPAAAACSAAAAAAAWAALATQPLTALPANFYFLGQRKLEVTNCYLAPTPQSCRAPQLWTAQSPPTRAVLSSGRRFGGASWLTPLAGAGMWRPAAMWIYTTKCCPSELSVRAFHLSPDLHTSVPSEPRLACPRMDRLACSAPY